MEDPILGGFYSTTKDGTEHITGRRKPLEDNGLASRFLYVLSRYTKQDKYEKSAKKAIQASASDSIIRREGRIIGNLATALEVITAGYVEFSVVSNTEDKKAQLLFDASSKVYEPRKIQHYEKPGRYPDADHPVVYICSTAACSRPLKTADTIASAAAKFVVINR